MTDAPERIWIDPRGLCLGWAVSDDEVTEDDVAYLRADLCDRNAILEEAAKVAEEYAAWHTKYDDGLSGFGYMSLGAEEVAAAIRATKEAK